MRQFQISKQTGKDSNRPKSDVMSMINDIDPSSVSHNVVHLLDEIKYACDKSLDDPHPHIKMLKDACTNLAALIQCIPVLMAKDRVGSVLQNPDILMNLPNIDIKNVNLHVGVMIEAARLYIGVDKESMSNQDIAKQFFSLISNILSSNDDKGSLDRVGKLFARIVNDRLNEEERNNSKDNESKEI